MSFKISTLPEFSPPGNLPDLTDENKEIWSKDYISKWMNDEIAGGMDGPCGKPRPPLSQFFNGTVTPFNTTQEGDPITWFGFPKLIATRYNHQEPLRWQIADANRLCQDEYLEWSVARDQNNKITLATFTCEGPEYWQFMGDYQPDTLFELYKKYNPLYADQMSKEDFFLTNQKTGATVYNPMNYWNMSSTSGTIAHLVQPNNTLSAEIDIVAQATVMRIGDNGEPIDDPTLLINCSKYGNPGRNSDPTIGAAVHKFAHGGASVSIKDPVAIYIHEIDTSNFVLDKGGNNYVPLPDGTVNWDRGKAGQGLRLRIEIPENTTNDKGEQLTVSDIYDNLKDTHVMYAAQIADYISMGVSGVTINSVAVAQGIPCPCAKKDSGDSLLPGKGTFDGIIRDSRGVEQHRLPKYKFRVR